MGKFDQVNVVHLLGIRLSAENQLADFYTFMFDTKEMEYIPLVIDDQIVLYEDKNCLENALALTNINILQIDRIDLEVELLDFAYAFYVCENGSVDDPQSLIAILNNIEDILPAVRTKVPLQFQEMLRLLANHMTFDKNFDRFIDQHEFSRNDVIISLQWCLGAVMSHARIVRSL